MCTRRLVTEPNVPGKGTSAMVSNSCPWPYHQQDMIATIKKHRIIQISLVRTRHNRNVWCLDRSNQLRRQAGHSNRHLVMRISIHNCIRERAGSPTRISSIRIPETIYIHTHTHIYIYIYTYYLHLMLIGLSLSLYILCLCLCLCLSLSLCVHLSTSLLSSIVQPSLFHVTLYVYHASSMTQSAWLFYTRILSQETKNRSLYEDTCRSVLDIGRHLNIIWYNCTYVYCIQMYIYIYII